MIRAMRLPVILASAALAVLLLLTACHSTPAAPGLTAECPVCKHEGDLACVCVKIEADTPHCECNGATYYFCSEECRKDFSAHPERYLKH